MRCSSDNRNLLKLRVIFLTLLLLWAFVIFMFSAQNAETSSETSGGFVSVIIENIYSDFNDLPQDVQNNLITEITVIVRKSAHFFEYFVLGALSFFAVITFVDYKVALCDAAALLICVVYSVSDELHQYFVPGRACRALDVLIDSSGSLLALVLLTAVFVKSRKLRSRLGDTNA